VVGAARERVTKFGDAGWVAKGWDAIALGCTVGLLARVRAPPRVVPEGDCVEVAYLLLDLCILCEHGSGTAGGIGARDVVNQRMLSLCPTLYFHVHH
jgi:hypothetical protein